MTTSSHRYAAMTALLLTLSALSCSETRNLGSSSPHGLLPVDERNPILLTNDGVYDNWQGEYAILLASSGGPRLAGIVIGTSPNLPKIEENIAGWRGLVEAAQESGLTDIPYPMPSIGAKLVRPANGQFEATTPNHSEGARLIVDLSRQLSLPYRPLVVVTGGRLTDVADAFLIDPTVAQRTVVVSSLGRCDRHRPLSLRAGQRVLRPTVGRPVFALSRAAGQSARSMDPGKATAGVGPSEGQ